MKLWKIEEEDKVFEQPNARQRKPSAMNGSIKKEKYCI
jgi:hypothetical protein